MLPVGSLPVALVPYKAVKAAFAGTEVTAAQCIELSPADVLASILRADLSSSRHPIAVAAAKLLKGVRPLGWHGSSIVGSTNRLDPICMKATSALASSVWGGKPPLGSALAR